MTFATSTLAYGNVTPADDGYLWPPIFSPFHPSILAPCPSKPRFHCSGPSLRVGCSGNAADNVVPLGEEGDPVAEGSLLLVGEILPLGTDVLGLC